MNSTERHTVSADELKLPVLRWLYDHGAYKNSVLDSPQGTHILTMEGEKKCLWPKYFFVLLYRKI